MSQIYVPESAMAIAAHPDDIEYSCAGTLARWAQGGTRVCYVLCTSGEAGITEPGITREKACAIREKEARAAAQIAGAAEVIFLHEPDGLLEATLELRKKLVREIRRFRPEVVMAFDPTIVWAGDDYINHPDHRAAGLAAVDAAFPAAGQPMVFSELADEGILPHKIRKFYSTGWNGNTYVNIDHTIDLKLKALRAHASQMKNHDPEEMVRGWAAEAAKGKEMNYAESFRIVTLVDDETWQKVKEPGYWNDLLG